MAGSGESTSSLDVADGMLCAASGTNFVTRPRHVTAAKHWIDLVQRNASSTNELPEVTAAICLAGVDIVVISADNVTSSGFPAIHSVTQRENVPVYCTEPDLVKAGAAGAIGVNFYDWGRQTALMAARILAGQDPGTIPREEVSSIRTVTSAEAGR